jgi:hypothetical protein
MNFSNITANFKAIPESIKSGFNSFKSKIASTFTRKSTSADSYSADGNQGAFGLAPNAQRSAPLAPGSAKPATAWRKTKIGAALTATAVFIGGGVAIGVTHAQWVPLVVAGAHHLGVALAALGAAIGAISPVGWVFIGVLGALAIGFAGYAIYKHVQGKKANTEKNQAYQQVGYNQLNPQAIAR